MGNTVETASGRPRVVPLGRVIDRLRESPNVSDQRKARDIGKLEKLAQGPWSGRLVLIGADCGRRWSLELVMQLDAASLVWRGRPEPHHQWTLLLGVPHNYPMVQPDVQFVGNLPPYCSHVIHRQFLPDETGLPLELRQFVEAVRAGRDGACCYLRADQWSPLTTHDLAMVIWQVSRILTGARLFGERGSLNNHARDYYQRLQEEGRLPLGPALPVPWDGAGEAPGRPDVAVGSEGDEEAIEWISQP
jgi:hypothetical protein